MRRKEATEWKNKSKGVKKKEEKRVEKIGSGVRLAYKTDTVRMVLLGRGIPICHKAFFLFFFLRFIYLLAVVGLHCCAWAFSSCGKWGLLFSNIFSLQWLLLRWTQALGTWASVAAAHRLRSFGLPALEHWLSSCGVHTDLIALQYVGSSPTRDWTSVPCIARLS